jgi:hypothetical protein
VTDSCGVGLVSRLLKNAERQSRLEVGNSENLLPSSVPGASGPSTMSLSSNGAGSCAAVTPLPSAGGRGGADGIGSCAPRSVARGQSDNWLGKPVPGMLHERSSPGSSLRTSGRELLADSCDPGAHRLTELRSKLSAWLSSSIRGLKAGGSGGGEPKSEVSCCSVFSVSTATCHAAELLACSAATDVQGTSSGSASDPRPGVAGGVIAIG